MKKSTKDKKNIAIIVFVIFLLALIALLTKYSGSVDVGDYADAAKFFAGEYQAKLRTSHSVLYGWVHAPFVKLTDSFLFFKITSILWLSLLIISIYYISNKNKKTLLLTVACPIVWYMAPWINSIQLCSLLFLWGYYFIEKYDKNRKCKNLFYSGLLIGLAWAFWDPIIYFAIILAVCFLYNKKFYSFVYFILALFVGGLPKLITDQILFGFAFYSILKHLFAEITFLLYGGIYTQKLSSSPINIVLTLLFVPFFSYLFFKKENFLKHRKTIIFLILSTAFIIIDSQIRYTLLVIPIIILLLGEILNNRKFGFQIIIFLFLTIIVINPYIIQIKYETNGKEFGSFIKNLPNIQLNPQFTADLIREDLDGIAKDYPSQKFIVGNKDDNYQELAHLYWQEGRDDIKEFVSIQDYMLYLNREATISSKTLCSASETWNRRDICVKVELRKTIKDETDYNAIKYAISLEKNIDLDNFKLIKNYQVLSVFGKEEI